MRRPLKPFVTEYKASSRRNAGTVADNGLVENERPGPKAFDFAARPDSDDTYDAAMRAADALFSIPSEPKPVAHREQPVESQSQPYFGTDQPAAAAPEKNGGRILRVLDEAPSPEYAALEAERAPKRRGRKPGSKNKPKAATIGRAREAVAVAPSAAAVSAAPVIPAARKVAAISASSTDATPCNSAPTAMARVGKRYPWARDKLKPGEDWKRRRLPKVCW